MMPDGFLELLHDAIDRLDVHQARREVEPFVRQPAAIAVWSPEFFHDIAGKIRFTAIDSVRDKPSFVPIV